MKKLDLVAMLSVVGVISAILLTPTEAADTKVPTTKEIMKKAGTKDVGLVDTIKASIKEESPKWEEIQKQSKELSELAGCLGKNDPPRGEKESWTKLATGFSDCAKNLDAACQKKDQKLATEIAGKLGATCGNCHKEHKPKK